MRSLNCLLHIRIFAEGSTSYIALRLTAVQEHVLTYGKNSCEQYCLVVSIDVHLGLILVSISRTYSVHAHKGSPLITLTVPGQSTSSSFVLKKLPLSQCDIISWAGSVPVVSSFGARDISSTELILWWRSVTHGPRQPGWQSWNESSRAGRTIDRTPGSNYE